MLLHSCDSPGFFVLRKQYVLLRSLMCETLVEKWAFVLGVGRGGAAGVGDRRQRWLDLLLNVRGDEQEANCDCDPPRQNRRRMYRDWQSDVEQRQKQKDHE